jgi:protein SCO1/2
MAHGKPVAAVGARCLAVAALLLAAQRPVGADAPHRQATDRTAVEAPTALPANTPGFPNIKGVDFRLLDGQGRVRTARSPAGRPQLLFFGYANCQAICSVALPRMAAAVDALDRQGVRVTPVLITVDSARDTLKTLEPALRKHHPRFVGLTGTKAQLAAAYRAFQVERQVVFTHPDYGDVYAHGSYFYLLAADGRFLTLLPPVLGPERIAEVARGYLE